MALVLPSGLEEPPHVVVIDDGIEAVRDFVFKAAEGSFFDDRLVESFSAVDDDAGRLNDEPLRVIDPGVEVVDI